jgi:hypothetical protein
MLPVQSPGIKASLASFPSLSLVDPATEVCYVALLLTQILTLCVIQFPCSPLGAFKFVS